MSKRIEYIAPVEWIAGSLSGRQPEQLKYGGGSGYEVAVGETRAADVYQPRLIAKVLRAYTRKQIKCFCVRTKTSVHMSAANKRNLSIMGGAGALYAALLRDKAAAIYADIVAVKPKQLTLRAFVVPLLRAGLRDKVATIDIADGVGIVNPWISSAEPNVPLRQAVLDKFASELSNP